MILGREEETHREKGRNTNVKEIIDQLPPVIALTRDQTQTHNLGVSPDQESDPQAFGVQPTEPPGRGLSVILELPNNTLPEMYSSFRYF